MRHLDDGGHTKAMMECLHGEGHMYATDVDPEESAKAPVSVWQSRDLERIF